MISIFPNVTITFCNKAYAAKWFADMSLSNPMQLKIIEAIIEDIHVKDGGEINQLDIFRRHPEISKYVQSHNFKLSPTNGQRFSHNGEGIRHAKYSPSKSVAVIWQKIRSTIYVTFDDHAPIRYHRAIYHLRDIKLDGPMFPKRPRNKRKFIEAMKVYKRDGYVKTMPKLNLYKRFYK